MPSAAVEKAEPPGGKISWNLANFFLQSMAAKCNTEVVGRGMVIEVPFKESDTMPHRRTSGAKVRSHKIGVGNSRYAKGKQARLMNKRALVEYFRFGDGMA